MDSCEPRRLLAFVYPGASTLNGSDYQSIDRIVQTDNGYIAAGIFSADTNFGTGKTIQPRGRSDVFLTLVNADGVKSLVTIGGESRQRLKFKNDRIDFAANPIRVAEDSPLGVGADPRRADEYVSAMKVGPDGKLYVALLFRRSVSLDTQSSSAKTLVASEGFEDEFFDSAILRYDISGGTFKLDRTIQIGGPFNDIVQDFAFDEWNNLIVAGSFQRRCDFDPTSGKAVYDPNGRGDAFIAKYSATRGTLQWVSQLGSDAGGQEELETAYSIAVDADNNIYAGGSFAGDADFGRNGKRTNRDVASADKFTDAYTMKLDSNGALAWIRSQGGSKFDGIKAVTLAPDGGVYSVGFFEDKADLDPRANVEQTFENPRNNDGNTDLFFNRFDTNGDLNYVKQIAGTGFELIASATTNASGDLVIAGSFYGTADFDPSSGRATRTTPKGGNDDANQGNRDRAYSGFVATYGKSSGKFRSQVQIDGLNENDVFIHDASLGVDGNVLVAGRYREGFNVAGTSLTVRSRQKLDDTYREDGFALLLGEGPEPIV